MQAPASAESKEVPASAEPKIAEISALTVEDVKKATGLDYFPADAANSGEKFDILLFKLAKLCVYLRMQADKAGIKTFEAITPDTFIDSDPTRSLQNSQTVIKYIMYALIETFLPIEEHNKAKAEYIPIVLTFLSTDIDSTMEYVKSLENTVREGIFALLSQILLFDNNATYVKGLGDITRATMVSDTVKNSLSEINRLCSKIKGFKKYFGVAPTR